MPALAPLRISAFRRLAATYGLNELSWGLATVALAALAYDKTGSALAPTALFLASTFVPALLTPALTARLDRVPVREALGGLYLAEAAAFGSLALFAERLWLPVLLLLALIDGVLALTGRALTRASVAAVLTPTEQLRDGNALLNVLFASCLMGGPALGGLLLAAWGTGAPLAVAAGAFTAMALIALGGRALPGATSGDEPWLQRARDGLSFARGDVRVRRLLTVQAATLVCCALTVPVEIVYARESLAGTSATYGLLLAAWGAGTVIGSLVFARWATLALTVLVPGSLLTTAAGYGVLALAPGLALALVGCVLGGMGNGVQVVAVVQALQERVAPDLQARVMGLAESVNAAAVGVGFLCGGTLAALASPRAVFACAAFGVVVMAGGFVLALREDRARHRTLARGFAAS